MTETREKRSINTDYNIHNVRNIPLHLKYDKLEIGIDKLSSVVFSTATNNSNQNFIFLNTFINKNELLAHDLQF